MSVQGVFNYRCDKTDQRVGGFRLGPGNSLIACVVIWFFTGRPPVRGLFSVSPIYLLSGGIIGAVITYTVIRSMQSLGPAQTALLIVVAQIITAYVIQLFGWFGTEKMPFEWHKLLGAAVAVAGIIIFQR